MLEFVSSEMVSGLDFGLQMSDRWYTNKRVPSPFGELTMHFAPSPTRHKIQSYWNMCTKAQAPLKSKYLIFFFDCDDLQTLAQTRFPSTVTLKNVTDDFLRPLTDCEIARVKVGKGDVTFYVYAIKWSGTSFGRMKELCDLIEKLLNMDEESVADWIQKLSY